ncbi:MAG TPA: Pvc16 family protein, partial [Chloroflexota bacterium]|nr:Pvc16 family protein [Chloroflexota bacterium]
MLPDIARALEQLLHERGGISPREVDVRFEAPTTEWVDSLTRPTINLFLCDVRENTELRRMDVQMS